MPAPWIAFGTVFIAAAMEIIYPGTAAWQAPKTAKKKKKKERTGLRSFVVAAYDGAGILLVQARQRKGKDGRILKNAHFQLPGGHVEQRDIDRFGKADAQRIAAARELHQKTGIDLRQDLDRLSPVPPVQEFGGRSYFAVDLQPADAVEGGVVQLDSSAAAAPLPMRLSKDLTGFAFETDCYKAVTAILQQGGHHGAALARITECAYAYVPATATPNSDADTAAE